jgi:adenylate cyclase
VSCDGDWYGTTVNRAARVAEAAAPGELMVTEAVREAARASLRLELVERGERRLKGLPDCSLHAALAAA